MGQLAVQVLGAVLVAQFVFLALYARARLPVVYQPSSSDFLYRVLHAKDYLSPTRRICPGCGYANVPTAVRCENPIDHGSKKDTLDLKGEFITREDVRLWGLRTLIVLIVSAALVLGQAWILFVILAVTALWIVIPMVMCHREGRIVFLLVSDAILAVTGIVHIATTAEWRSQMTTVGQTTLLPVIDIGSTRFDLNTGYVTPAMVWLNAACALAALVSVGLSVAGHRQNPRDRVYRPWTVFALGITLSALLLAAVSMLQQLTGLMIPYALAAIVAFGWFLSASLMHTFTQALKKVKLRKTVFIRVHRIPIPPRPKAPPRPRRRDLAEQITYTLERILSSTSHAIIVIVIQTLNVISRTFITLVNLALCAIEWVLLYIWAVLTTLVSDLLRSFPVLFRIASSGYRIALFAPALLVGASVMLAFSADEAQYYLQSGYLLGMLGALVAFAGAALAISIAASLYVTWPVVHSFLLAMRDDYIAQAIIFFVVSLDTYGIWRLIFHMPSHFGILSWALNGVLVLAALYSFVIRRTRVSTGHTP
jgi:hypothetical protein